MHICIECKKDVLDNYQEITTKRHTKVVICDKCLKKYQGKEGESARDCKKPIREH